MIRQIIGHIANRYRPSYGWVAFALLVGTLFCVALSVLDVEWVPNDWVVLPALLIGFVITVLLSHQRSHLIVSWLILGTMGITLAFFLAAELWPPAHVMRDGGNLPVFWRNQIALFFDLAGGWLKAVREGGRSTETVVFTFGLAFTAWMAAAGLAWTIYREKNPYLGLTFIGIALAANTFYGRAANYWVVFFIGLAVTASTYLNYLYREEEWERSGTDFSSEVRGELILYAAGLSMGIMSLAMAIPSINFQSIAEAFQQQEAIVAAEQTLSRAFAGVAQPRMDEGIVSTGSMPRSFLIGEAPELLDTIVMTATVSQETGSPISLEGIHWRSVSFDIYTGRGWRRSPEREENIDTGQIIPIPDELAVMPVTLSQTVEWTYDRRATRYTLGTPILFSHDLTTLWRGRDDLVGVRGRNNAPGSYKAQTQVIIPTAEQLRDARLDDIPPEIRARYTSLPDSVPDRVYQLARQVTGVTDEGTNPPTPYDQARAIEAFLRQYPYSLDLPAPPPEGDIVDYFLFDLQTGFCDYYASAMVVMARALGLPARLGVGFLQQPADANGVQTLRQLNAHSWAEIYFAGSGWVEFEPTAPFTPASTSAPTSEAAGEPQAAPTMSFGTDTAIPQRAPQRNIPWISLLGIATLASVAWLLWGRRLAERQRRNEANLDDVQLAYAHLLDSATAIGFPPHPAQTPAEFTAELLATPPFGGPEGEPLRSPIERLARLFTERQYGGEDGGAALPAGAEARATWSGLRAPLRRLAWRRRLGRGPD